MCYLQSFNANHLAAGNVLSLQKLHLQLFLRIYGKQAVTQKSSLGHLYSKQH